MSLTLLIDLERSLENSNWKLFPSFYMTNLNSDVKNTVSYRDFLFIDIFKVNFLATLFRRIEQTERNYFQNVKLYSNL